MRTSIYRARSGRYVGRYQLDGRWISAPETFTTKVGARDWLAGIIVERRDGTWVDPAHGRLTFKEWGETFWSLVEVRAKTRDQQKNDLYPKLETKWGDRALEDITPLEVMEWVAELKASGRAPSTVRSTYWLFHKIMAWAVAPGGKLQRSPCPASPQLPKAQPRKVVPLDAEQIGKLAAAVPARWCAAIWTLGYGGFRIGELAALRADDIDFKRGTIRVDEKAVEIRGKLVFEPFPKTTRGLRTITLPWAVMERLAAHYLTFRSGVEPGDLVFVGDNGAALRPRNFANRVLTPAGRVTGISGLTPHVFRHTAVSTWVQMGASMKQVADRAGCTVSTVQTVYAHLFPDDDDRLRKAMDAAIAAAPRPQAHAGQQAADGTGPGSGARIIQLRPQAG